MADDNKKRLYDELSKRYDLGSFEQFSENIKDETKRRKLYDATSKIYSFGSYEQFSGKLGFGANPDGQAASAAPEAPAAPAASAAPGTSAAQPAREENSAGTPGLAVPQASTWNERMEELGRSVMPGTPVSMPERKEKEPEANPFPYRGGLEKEMEGLAEERARATEGAAGDLALMEEYDRRLKEFHDSLDPTSKKTRENEQWLREHKAAYEAAKESDAMRAYDSAEEDYLETARAVGNAEEKIAERKNREEMASPAEVVATGKTVFGGDNAGRSDKEYMYRKLADELYKSSDKEYRFGSKYEDGYDGGPLERLWTASRQFVLDADNNVDSGSLTFGASKGLAEREAREVGDEYNRIITKTLKDMKMSDGDMAAVLSSIEMNGQKIRAMEDELKASSAEIDAMTSAYEDMVRARDPKAREYGESLQKKIDEHNRRVNEEFNPLLERYEGDRKAYETVMSAIDEAVENGLTGGQKALLDAMERFTEAKALSEPVRSTASKAGAGAEQSAEFMLDFILTGGIAKGGTRVAAKLAKNRALKKFGAEALKGMAVKPGLGLRLAADAAVSGIRTAAVFPRTIQAYGENATAYSGKDYAGRINFDRTQANALGNALLTQFIEYWSEGFGEYFGEAEQALFRSVTRQAPRQMIGKTLRSYSGSIGKYLDYGKFDGMFNEMLEEVVGSGLNAISGWLSGDRVGDAEAMKEFFAGENMATLVLSFLPMSVIGAATNVGAYHDMRKRYDEAVEALNPFIESGAVSRAELERLSKDVPNLTPQEVKDRIVGIADRAREHNGGRLPGDFAKHVVGYLEGDFAMNLRADEWEDSREKMAVVDAYASAYSNPDPRMAWDAGQNVRETREAAVRAGFSEEELDDDDAYVLAQEARTMRDEDPARAGALLAYATAKAADAGIRMGYDERTRLSAEEYEENVRLNLDRGGTVLTATLPVNGQDATVFVTSTDATVNPDGSVSTPTGADGIVTYRESETGEEKTVKAGALSNARERNTAALVASVNGTYAEYRAKAFDQMANTVSLSGRSRAISEKVGQTVVVTDHGGVYEPFRVERMTNGGMNVVVGGERKALQGVARRMNLDIPAGTYLEAPVDKFYDLLAKEEDGSLSTIVPEGSKRMADVPRADLSGVAGTDRTIMVDGTPTTVHVDQVGPDGVWYNYADAEGNQRSGAMSAAEFQEKMAGVPEQVPAAETEVSVRQAAPAQAAPQAQTPAPDQAQRQSFPVDENTGNKVYDHPSVTPEMAVNELFSGVEPGTKNAENRRRYVEGKAEKAAADVAEAENRIAGLRAQRALVDEWELPDGEEIDAFERRKDAEKRKFDDEIAEIEDGLTELRRKAAHWKEVRELAGRIGGQAAPANDAAEPAEAADERKPSMRSAARGPGRRRSRTQRAVVSAVRGWEKRTGIKVTIYESPEEVEDEAAAAAIAKGEPPTGWYDPATGSVYVYLPAIDSVSELDKTFIHEAVSHRGLRGLLGDEDYAKLCDRVWNEVMTRAQREYYLAYNSHLSGTDEYLRRAAADEYIARLSENLDFADNRNVFQKIVDWVRELLGKDDPLSREEIVEDAKARAADYGRMTRRTLENLLADSLKLYEANTRRGREDAGLKREIGASVDGGAMQTGADEAGQTRFSVKSITSGGGLDMIEDNGRGMIAFETPDGRRFDAEHPITADDLRGLDDTVMAYMMKDARDVAGVTPEQEARIWKAYADQLNAFLAKGVPKDGLSGADRIKALWEWEVENTVYKSVSPNGDKQYSYSMDITRVCKKNEAVIKAISSMQSKVGYGITPGQIMDIYLQGVEEGYQVPCPVCYVFSHYINNGIVATVAIRGQEKYGKDLVDPSTLSDEEKAERIQMWYDRMKAERKFNEDNADEIENARQECAAIIEQIDILSQLITSGRLKGEAAKKAIRRVRELDNRFRAALALYTQAGQAGWIKQFAIREAKKGEKGFVPSGQPKGKKGEAPKAYVLWEDTWQGFPPEYALDLRLTAETIEKYPAIQRLRNARGSAGGKEIHFASNNDLGDIPMMLGTKDGVNYYMRAVLAGPGPERDALRKQARDRFASAHRYAQQQSLRGGQRMWSWSDNIERLAPDVFVNLMQLQMLGGALQAYSKQLEGVNLVASMGGYVNGSLMGYGKGWQELSENDIEVVDGREVLAHDVEDEVTEKRDGKDVRRKRPLAKAGAPVFEVTVDGATKKVTLLFDDVVGIDAYGRDADGRHLKGLFDLNAELDKAGNILVGMNDPHVRAAMADPRVFFIIPWHASGNSVHIVQQMLSYLGVDTDVKDYTDYTDVQEEKDLLGKDVGEHVAGFWEEHRNETDFPCGIEGGIPSGEGGKLSKEQEHYRELRDAIFLGIKYDTGKRRKGEKVYDTISVRELADLVARMEAGEEEAPAWMEADGRNLMAWPAEIMNDAFLSQALRKIGERVDEQKMTSTDKGFIYPYEYWDESSTYDTADVNGARYLEYCRRLGVRPKFVGMLDGRPAEKDKGNFADDTGYWKLLIDRRMYGVDGRFQDLDPVTTSEYDPKFVDPEWTEENFHKTLVADDKGAERIADKVIESEGIKFKEGGGIPAVDYGSDRKQDLRRYKALMAATKRIGIDDLVAMAAPEAVMSQVAKENEGSGTMFRRSDEIAAEYPNWMDDQTSTDVEGSQRGQNTQVAGTVGTYRKVGDWIEQNLGTGAKILDASSGLGLGTLALRERGFDVDDVEPYPGKGRKEQPTYGGEDAYRRAIEDGRQYDYVISNAVLNVIPDDWRSDVLANMARLLKPGGRMFINTRKAGEERTIRHKIELDSPREVLVGTPERINSYQRFFTPAELKEYVERELGDGYTVEIATKANSGTSGLAAVVVTKKPSTDGVDPNNPDIRFRRSGPEYEEETKRLFDRAKEHFGTTTDIREAGYVLPDGSMLDFSGRHWSSGGDNSWLNGMRQVDHRDISELEFERDGNTPSGFETNMPDFIQRGAIRLNGNAINLMMKPTREQEDALWKLIYRAEGTVDVDFGDGQSTEHYVSYDHAAPARIIQDIRRYFDEGIKPASNTIFRRSAPGFVSNAAAALGRIKMDKATPEQWLKMLEKEGGLKAGEDKWIGLSDWLKSLDRKTVTKQEIAEYIAENAIQIEEVEYDADQERTMGPIIKEYPGFFDAFSIDQNEATGRTWVDSIINDRLAIELYNQHHDDKIDVESPLSDDDFQKIIEFAEDVYKKGGEIRDINSTRLHYTTENLENKREIALVVPTVEPYHGDSPEIHFDDEATEGRAVAWARFGETTTSDDSVNASGKGDRVLVIDEIQSQRHQDARERGGYDTPESRSELDAAIAELREANVADNDAIERYLEYMRPMKERLDSDEITREEFDEFRENDPEAVRLDEASEEAHRRRIEVQDRVNAIRERYEKESLPAPAPFERNWHELAMKRMLRLAAEEGYDYVAWTTGDQQAERYDIGQVVSSIGYDEPQVKRYETAPSRHFVIRKQDGNKIHGYVVLSGEYAGVIQETFENGWGGEKLSEVVGKALAEQIINATGSGSIDGEGLRIGGEGMKGFYDDILVRFMNKYGKKWGVKVEDITLPNLEESARVMHAVRVTPEMKESVMKGQTMFRRSPVTPEQDAEYMAAVEAGDMAPEEARLASAERESMDERIGTMPQIIGSWVHGATRDEMPDGHKTDKGYFDPDANDLAICMDNVSDLRDAVATAIHETIAYKGLQGILGERFRPAMATLYASLDEEGRAWVNAYMGRNGLRPGDEAIANGILEYAADLAERGGDSVLGEVGEALGQVVSEVFDAAEFAFTPRELHYVLWAAAEHAKNPAWLESPSDRARNVLKKRELGINETDPNRPTDPDGGPRFRKPTLGTAKEDYEAAMNYWRTSMILENQDADLPVRIGMEKVMQEVGKQELSEEEDYATRHNLASSRADSELHDFMLFHFSPMIEKVREVQKRLAKRRSDREGTYQRIVDYLYAVSGLERNEWERANGGEDKDWSGITSLMGYEDKDRWEDAEREARDMIDKFREDLRDAVRRKGQTDAEAQAEADAMLDDLWDAIRSCTDFSLEHAYSHGLLSRDEFERLHGTASKPRLWDYYLPLRGFSEKTAEDEYSYATLAGQGSGDSVVMAAKGRWTEADNPLAYILYIAEREIVQGNENWARQALLRFTIDVGKNTLLSERSPWYVKDGNTGKWVLAYPEPVIDPNTNKQTGTESIEAFEARMRALKARGEARQGRKGLKLDQVMANKGHRNQHLIHVKVGGADRMIWVNGNPAMAKAVSGYGRTPKYAWFRSAGRKLSNLFTTYSLDFTVKNLIRDLNYSITALHMKEDREYRHHYAKNWERNFGYGAFALPMIRLAAMWDSGALQSKPEWKRTKREQQFIDFMHDGGQTGYTVVRSVELLKEELRKTMAPTMLRQAVDAAKINVAGVTIPIFHLYSFGVRTLNEAFELLTRFTTYQTSRDMGRSGQRAAHDAKEISVNFNRRGAQSGDGTFWGNLAAFLGGTHYFYNAGVQGFDNFLRLYKARPIKMGLVSTGILTMGMLTPMINSLLAGIGGDGDDDDDKKRRKRDWYWNLPEWVRRNNLVLGWPEDDEVDENGNVKKKSGAFYFCIPLPVEFRALYGLGDITASAFIYHKMPNRKFGTVAADIISTAAEIVPFNPIEGIASSESAVESVFRSFTPDILIPAVDIVTNRDYTGRALMKENPFTKVVPKNQGAYASTPRLLVDVCQDIGATIGYDIAPGVIRDIMSNYGGGYYRFAEDISKQLFTDADRPRRWDDIPFLSGFTGHIDEDRGNTFYNGVLTDYKRLSQEVVLKMNLYNRSDFIDEKMAYEYPETLPEKAKIQMILSGKDYELGKEYYFGMKDTGTGEFHKVQKVHKTGKQAGKPYSTKEEIKTPGVETLRKRWKDARDVWVTMEKGTPEEADAKREVEEAWHKYCDAQADLAEKLLKIEYGE